MYDPQTGEASMEYEGLTGKPNPLLTKNEKPKKEPSGAQKMSDEIRKTMDFIPHDLEYKRRNRFLVHFPEEFGINHLQIETVVPSRLVHRRQHLLGLNFINHVDITDTVVTVRELENTNVMSNLINRMDKKFDFTIEMVSGQNVVLEKWIMKNCFIKELSTDSLSYKADGVLNTNITISINKLEIK